MMPPRFHPSSPAALASFCLAACAAGAGDQVSSVQELRVPSGFEIEVFADGLTGVRTLRLGPDGSLYAALSDPGRIVRLAVPEDPDAPAGPTPAVEEVVRGLRRPYGLAFHGGDLYVGEEHQVVRLAGPELQAKTVVVPDLPAGGHWTREIAFGPDGWLYVSVGSSCNVCEEDDPRRAAVTRYRPDGTGEERYAEGLRNAAGLAFHPETGELWASQNERDNLGDDVPPEEINVLRRGAHYGWPWCYGQGIPNPEFGDPDRCRATEPPALEIQAHGAPLGMVFYTGSRFPPEYRGDVFLALHGSWNRTVPTGYEVVRVEVEEGRPVAYEPFAGGWLDEGGEVSGRPVYPEVGPDGSLYVSDDLAGRVWRIRYTGH